MSQSGLSPAYKRASDDWKRATDQFSNVQRMYRENLVDFNQLTLAQVAYKAATKRFDEAFHKEHRRTSKCADRSGN